MASLEIYAEPSALPGSTAGRIGLLLGLAHPERPIDDVGLADLVTKGLPVDASEALSAMIGRGQVVGPLIPEATLRRARTARKPLSREMSERLYEVGRVVDAVSRIYRGDRQAILRFLATPHTLLGGRTPLAMAQSNSAGADAVINLLRRADAGFAP